MAVMFALDRAEDADSDDEVCPVPLMSQARAERVQECYRPYICSEAGR